MVLVSKYDPMTLWERLVMPFFAEHLERKTGIKLKKEILGHD